MQDHLTSVRCVIVQKRVKRVAQQTLLELTLGSLLGNPSERLSESQVAVAPPSHRRAGTVASVRARTL